MKTIVLACALLIMSSCRETRAAALRVCADPDNLPYSNDHRVGFENRIAQLVADEMEARVEYVWWPQRRGFLRNTLNAERCDVVIGLPAAVDMALTTRPYYRSSYAFVSRADRHLDVEAFDDERLRELRIGVQLIGDDGANSPPAHALSRRGIVKNVVGFPVYDDPARIVHAVAEGTIDIAVVWGPLAGYAGSREPVPIAVVPVKPQFDPPALPLAFDISMAVRPGDSALRQQLDSIIERRGADLANILAEYHVPRVDREEGN